MGSLSDFFPEAPPSLLAVVQDEKSSNTPGGNSTTTFTTRVLNTIDIDPDSLITLSSNTFSSSINCGITWSCPAAFSGAHSTRLVRVSDSAVIANGSSEGSDTSESVTSRSIGATRITAGETYRIEHRVATFRSSDGFGIASPTGEPEIYSIVQFWR